MTQLQAIRSIVQTMLQRKNDSGLNEAIRIVSHGRFQSVRDAEFQLKALVYDDFYSLNTGNASWAVVNDRLKRYCGIDLTNSDTGSILGSDAKSGTILTNVSVVPDSTSKASKWPDGRTSIKGLVISAPPASKLTSAQQQLVKDIYNRWAAPTLTTIEKALGLSFTQTTAKIKSIAISFNAPPSDDTMSLNFWNNQMMYADLTKNKLTLYINMKFNESSVAKDRLLAMEMARALFKSSAAYLTEGWFDGAQVVGMHGLASMVAGADDVLKQGIWDITRNAKSLSIGTTDISEGGVIDNAALGYLTMRYIAKEIAEHPSTLENYSTDGKKVTLGSGFKGEYSVTALGTLETIDASKTSQAITFTGKSDKQLKIQLGKGKTIVEARGKNITIYNYKSNQDVIKFIYNDKITSRMDVKDRVIFSDDITVRIKDAVGKKVLFQKSDGSNWVFSPEKIGLPIGTGYKNGSNETVVGANSTTFNGTVDGRLYAKVKTIDMRTSKKATTVYGNTSANTIYASQGGSKMYGLGGNDTLVGGAGKDTFYFGTADGTDIVKSYNGNQDVIRLTSGKYTAAQFKSHVKLNKANGEVDITNGKTKVRIMNALGQKVTVYSADGKVVYNTVVRDNNPSLNKKNGTVTLNKNYTGTMDLRSKPYTTMTNVNAAAATHKVTLYGNGKNNTLTAGKGGSILRGFGGTNTLVGSTGVDTFYVGKGEGHAIVKNFAFTSEKNTSAGDTLQLTSGTQLLGGQLSGMDLILKFNNGNTAKIVNGVGKLFKINGKVYSKYWAYNNPANTYLTYYQNGSLASIKTTSAFNGTLDMRRYQRAKTVDAQQSTKAVNIYGVEGLDQTFYASRGGGQIASMNGNDKIYCNNGADTIVFGKNYGQDTVYNSRKNDIVYLFDITNIKQVNKGKVTNGVMKLSFTGRNDILSIDKWNANSSMNTIQLGNKQKYRINANGTFTKI